MSKSIFHAAVLAITLSSSSSRADFASYTCRGPDSGPVQVILNGSACQGFRVTSPAREVVFSRIASGHLLASKDGRTVVMLEDYLPARVNGTTVEALYDLDVVINPHVLVVYRDGKRVAAYDLASLVKDLGRVEPSISHIRWVAKLPSEIGDKQFTVVTTSKRELVFDTRTGAILEERAASSP